MGTQLKKADVQRYGLLGDSGFSAAWNQDQIKKSIIRAEEMHKKRKQDINEGIAERADLVYSYIRHMVDNKKDMKIEEYAGWHNLKALWGQRRLLEIQDRARMLGYNI